MVYDTGDPTEPLKKEWFELQQRQTRWTSHLTGRLSSSGEKDPNRCYAAEHVLEWQLLKLFIDEDQKKGSESRCWSLLKHFNEELPKASYSVKVAKNNGKLGTDNHFEFESKDHSFDGWENKDQIKPRLIDWIGT